MKIRDLRISTKMLLGLSGIIVPLCAVAAFSVVKVQSLANNEICVAGAR